MKKIVVVIPAYKAADTLPGVIRRIPSPVMNDLHRLLVIEDGGPGVPKSAGPALLSEFSKIEVLSHEKNRGYGAAQKTGFRRALELECDIAVLLHADGQYAPEEMGRLCEPLIENKADIVLGSRMKSYRSALQGGMPLYKFAANIILTGLENLAFGLKLSEYHSGYMLYSRTALEAIPFERLSDTFHFDGEMLMVGLAKKNLRVADLPIPTFYGNEISHLKPLEYGTQVLRTVFNFWRGKYDF